MTESVFQTIVKGLHATEKKVDFIIQITAAMGMIPNGKSRLQMNPQERQAMDFFLTSKQWSGLSSFVKACTSASGHVKDSVAWEKLYYVLKDAALLQGHLRKEADQIEPFERYARIYDAVIGQPCLDNFMANYLNTVKEQFLPDLEQRKIISFGCGTGLVEDYIIQAFGLSKDQLYGIDISAGMIQQARKRICADQMDILSLSDQEAQWDLVFCGLNVFHYLSPDDLEAAIAKAAECLQEGAYFVGDFITPDHIRWYPNVIFSEDQQVLSLRNPSLVELDGKLFQESEIFNIHQEADELWINYAGKHRRHLPPMHRVRQLFEDYFKGQVQLLDAHSLVVLNATADTCESTRYVVVAQK